ncbi:MAG: methyltransferase [Nitrospiraceae bacterium]|nr:methyltransferase [Nitrospiraceae bacterium]
MVQKLAIDQDIKEAKLTEDCLRDYGIRVLQPQRGYRFSVDSLLLADFVRSRRGDYFLDIGTGCGIIALILAKKDHSVKIAAIEIQRELAEIARENVHLNHLDGEIEIYGEDLNRIPEIFFAGSFDHVVANPPYRSPVSGRLCKNSQENLARHEILTDLGQILSVARHALHPGGRVSLIYPADRTVRLLTSMHDMGLEPKRLKMIHSNPMSQARLVLVEGCKDSGEEVRVLPPVFLNG